MTKNRARWAIIALLLVALVGGCTYSSTAADETAVCVGGGPIEGKGVKKVLGPDSGNTFIGSMDACYTYPTSIRTYAASGGDNADGSAIVAPSSDNISMRYEVAVRFKVNTKEGQVQRFHEQIGNRYDAHTDEGWNRLLDVTLRRELDTTLQRISRGYSGLSLYSDPALLSTVEDEIADGLRSSVNEALGGEYFCGPGHEYGSDECPEFEVSLTVIEPHDADTRAAFEAVEREEARTRAAEQSVETATQEALAIREVQEALAAGNSEVYALLQAIESGNIDFWVIEGDEGVTLPAPAQE